MKIRMTIWTLILALIVLLFYQNSDFYMSQQSLSLNLFFTRFDIPSMANATQVLIYFLAGFLLAVVFLYHERFKLRRQIKKLNIAFQSCAQQITEQGATESTPAKKKGFKLPGLLRKGSGDKPSAGSTAELPDEKPAQ